MQKRLLNIQFLVLFGVLLFFSNNSNAQQDSEYTQYMYNTMSINPAYAGSRGSLSALALYRAQWIGLDGAPRTMDFGVHSPIGVQGVGVGIGFINDQIGPSAQNEITANVSYALQLNEKGLKLNFGIKGGLSLLDVDPNKLTIYNPNDYDLRLSHFSAPIVGAGFFLYTDKWYVGLSSPNVLETEYYDDIRVSTATAKSHFYFTAGYVFEVNDDLKIKPATMVKATLGAPLAVDISANFLILKRLTLGAGYRWDADVSALAGFQITDQIMVGYAYDYTTTELTHYNNGSHEVFLRFELGTRYKPKVNPRFF